jgi:uncharacterized membrane protein
MAAVSPPSLVLEIIIFFGVGSDFQKQFESAPLAPVDYAFIAQTNLGNHFQIDIGKLGETKDAQMQTTTGQVRVGTRLLHRGFIAAGGILLIAAFGTDYIYYTTSLWQWANFSAWLITVGLIVIGIAVVLLLIDFATGRAGRLDKGSFMLVAAAALLSLANAFVHSRDAWTSVVPQGILLSAVSTILLIIAGARGWSLTLSRATGDRP